jgi:UDP-3-O-[3-hydroxymyristoyl] glucosamine N-acyltransferase
MSQSVNEIAAKTGCRLCGDGSLAVTGVASLKSATRNDLVFVEQEQYLEQALAGPAGAVIAGEFAADGRDSQQARASKPLLISSNPRLAFARAAALLHPRRRYAAGVHSSAVVHDSVRMGEGVAIEAHAVVEEGCILGNRVHLGPGVALGSGVVMGDDCDLRANVVVYPGVRMGKRVMVHGGAVLGSDGFGYVPDPATGRYEKFPQIGTLEIGDDVEIGANTTVDRGALDATVIERGVKLDNLVHIGHNTRIGEDVVIAAQTGVSGSSMIEKRAVVAGQVGIADHVRIGEGAILGAQCGVPSGKAIRGKGVLFWGTPARPIRQYLKELAALARMAKKRQG